MGILDTLLSLLGLGDSSSDDDRRETTVSVEREASADTEAAVKGTDVDTAEASADTEAAVKGTDVDTAEASADTDAAASTESLVDGSDEAAEPAEAVGTEGVETELGTAEAESKGETTAEHEASVSAPSSESVEVVKGIGPAYAERLANAGVDSVADLAAADVTELADSVDLSEKRVGRWIERAQER